MSTRTSSTFAGRQEAAFSAAMFIKWHGHPIFTMLSWASVSAAATPFFLPIIMLALSEQKAMQLDNGTSNDAKLSVINLAMLRPVEGPSRVLKVSSLLSIRPDSSAKKVATMGYSCACLSFEPSVATAKTRLFKALTTHSCAWLAISPTIIVVLVLAQP